jgi:hypothetical protein
MKRVHVADLPQTPLSRAFVGADHARFIQENIEA